MNGVSGIHLVFPFLTWIYFTLGFTVFIVDFEEVGNEKPKFETKILFLVTMGKRLSYALERFAKLHIRYKFTQLDFAKG